MLTDFTMTHSAVPFRKLLPIPYLSENEEERQREVEYVIIYLYPIKIYVSKSFSRQGPYKNIRTIRGKHAYNHTHALDVWTGVTCRLWRAVETST